MYTVYEEMVKQLEETPVGNLLHLQLVNLVMDLSLGIKRIETLEDVLKVLSLFHNKRLIRFLSHVFIRFEGHKYPHVLI